MIVIKCKYLEVLFQKKQIKDRFTRIVVREKYLEPSFIYVSHICKS